jgi:hypothetical protein
MHQQQHFLSLPIDTLQVITTYLTLPDFYQWFSTCSSMAQATDSVFVWYFQFVNQLRTESRTIDEIPKAKSKQLRLQVERRKKAVTATLVHQEKILKNLVRNAKDSNEVVFSIRDKVLNHVTNKVTIEFTSFIKPALENTTYTSGTAEQWIEDKWNNIIANFKKLDSFPRQLWTKIVTTSDLAVRLYKDYLNVIYEHTPLLQSDRNPAQHKTRYQSLDFSVNVERSENFVMKTIEQIDYYITIQANVFLKALVTQNTRIIDHMFNLYIKHGYSEEIAFVTCCTTKISTSIECFEKWFASTVDMNLLLEKCIISVVTCLSYSDVTRLITQYHVDVTKLDGNVLLAILEPYSIEEETKERLVNFFLDHKISNVESNEYSSVIYSAVDSDNYLLIKRLLEYGFSPNKTNSNFTALGRTLVYNHRSNVLQLMKLLFEYGADCAYIQEDPDSTILSLYAFNISTDEVKGKTQMLLDHTNIDINVFGTDYLRCINPIRALFIEPDREYDEMLELFEYLKQVGADINVLDEQGRNLMEWYNQAAPVVNQLSIDRNNRLIAAFGLH